jgi:hypothetical protein
MVTEACKKKNHVTVNGLVANHQREVFPTDKITLEKRPNHPNHCFDIPENRQAKLVYL